MRDDVRGYLFQITDESTFRLAKLNIWEAMIK